MVVEHGCGWLLAAAAPLTVEWWEPLLGVLFPALLVILLALLTMSRFHLLRLRRRTGELERLVATHQSQLREAALTDPLTRLKNRRFAVEALLPEFEAAARQHLYLNRANSRRRGGLESLSFGLLLVDIDRFRVVNDGHGHAAGDLVLQQLGGLLTESVRRDDVVLRWGGDRFLVILRAVGPATLDTFVTKIQRKVAGRRFGGKEKNQVISLTCSVGAVPYPFFASEPELLGFDQVAELARLALERAKLAGGAGAVQLLPGQVVPEREERGKLFASLDDGATQGWVEITAR